MIKTIVIVLSLCWGFLASAQNHEVCGTAQLDNLRKGLIIQDSTLVDGMVVYTNPDERAQFEGGYEEMKRYISCSINYPSTGICDGFVTTKVYVQFIVLKDGSIAEVKIMRDAEDCRECDAEAIRVIKSMPNWIPAKVNGQPVNSWFNLPIKFGLH